MLSLRNLINHALVCLVIFSTSASFAQEPAIEILSPMILNCHGPESTKDVRYRFHWQVLEKALELTKDEYGAYQINPGFFIPEDRQLELMEKKSDRLNVMIRETNAEFEKKFEPVRIPIDRNLIGYRILLIAKEKQKEFSKVQSLSDLKKFRFVQGAGWGDIQILQKAGLQVQSELYYDDLFKNTARKKYDALPRGLTEVQNEQIRYSALHPQLVTESKLLLYYPLPTYFWFHQSPEGKKLAQRVTKGMKKMIASGVYDKLFQSHFSEQLKALDLKKRLFISIENPYLPTNPPEVGPDWDYNPRLY